MKMRVILVSMHHHSYNDGNVQRKQGNIKDDRAAMIPYIELDTV
jgi:hypothetical protein